ncbi:MAG: hypothetical protein LBS74_07740 [Oscillospiraceae bacterium]|nr:hypothetical protein [Oscillospiraceae bacterium]
MYAAKWEIKDIIKLALYLVFLLGLIYIVLAATTVPKTLTTAERVWNVLAAQGYEPQDITQKYIERDENSALVKSIVIEKDDLRFEFFVFDNENNAIDLYGNARASIVLAKNALPNVEVSKKMANYCIYTLKAKGEYNVAIYVGTTAVYAYCNEENANEINKILDAIDYLN